jgi:hypothetical protein
MLPSVAWLLKIETDSILIKEKRKHLSKTYDRVSKKMKRKRLSLKKEKSIHRSIYRYTKVNSLSYIYIHKLLTVVISLSLCP